MPQFRVFMTGAKFVREPVEVGVFEASNEDHAISKASIEFGMHESRYLNIDNFLPDMVAKKLDKVM